jgi:hypothetical protein
MNETNSSAPTMVTVEPTPLPTPSPTNMTSDVEILYLPDYTKKDTVDTLFIVVFAAVVVLLAVLCFQKNRLSR